MVASSISPFEDFLLPIFFWIPEVHSGVGGMLLDCQGKCLGFFSEVVSPELVSAIRREDQKTIIFELEGLAVAIGLPLLQEQVSGKKLIVFSDNQAVQSCLIKCKSSNDHMDLIIKHICRTEEKLNLISRIESSQTLRMSCQGNWSTSS